MPPYHKGEECYNTKLTQQIVNNIINDIIQSTLNLKDIAKKYNVSYTLIRHINYGEAWCNKQLQYPLKTIDERNSIKEKTLDILKIFWLLENSTCSMQQIGEYFSVGRKTIERINSGKTHFSNEKDYPIRKQRKISTESVQEALYQGGIE